MVSKIVFTSKSVNLPISKHISNHQIKYNFLAISKCKLCDLWKMILWQIFAMAFKNGWGEEWQFNKSKSRGHGRYQSITRQSATIWLHFRARAGPSFCWKLTLFKNVFQVQTLWWCWWLVHSGEVMEIYFYAFAKKFRESNLFTENVTKDLISRNIFSMKVNFLFFHTVWCVPAASAFHLQNWTFYAYGSRVCEKLNFWQIMTF